MHCWFLYVIIALKECEIFKCSYSRNKNCWRYLLRNLQNTEAVVKMYFEAPWPSSILVNLQVQACRFTKKGLRRGCFHMNFWEIIKNSYSLD